MMCFSCFSRLLPQWTLSAVSVLVDRLRVVFKYVLNNILMTSLFACHARTLRQWNVREALLTLWLNFGTYPRCVVNIFWHYRYPFIRDAALVHELAGGNSRRKLGCSSENTSESRQTRLFWARGRKELWQLYPQNIINLRAENPSVLWCRYSSDCVVLHDSFCIDYPGQ